MTIGRHNFIDIGNQVPDGKSGFAGKSGGNPALSRNCIEEPYGCSPPAKEPYGKDTESER